MIEPRAVRWINRPFPIGVAPTGRADAQSGLNHFVNTLTIILSAVQFIALPVLPMLKGKSRIQLKMSTLLGQDRAFRGRVFSLEGGLVA